WRRPDRAPRPNGRHNRARGDRCRRKPGDRILRQSAPAPMQGLDAPDDGRRGAQELSRRRNEGTRSAIDLASKVKESYHASWITKTARRAVALAALHGTTHLRAFADVDSKARLEAVKALLAVKQEFRGIVELQVVAFPQDGLAREPGADQLMRAAMELGADVV